MLPGRTSGSEDVERERVKGEKSERGERGERVREERE